MNLITRRQLFKTMGNLLPVFVLPSIVTLEACSPEDPLIDINPSCRDCTNACRGTCNNICKNACYASCTAFCTNGCSNGCDNCCRGGDCSMSCWEDCSGSAK